MNVRVGTFVNVSTTFILLLSMAPFYFDPAWLGNPALAWFALSGLIVPALSMTLHTWSIRLLEPAIAAALTSTSPVFSILVAARLNRSRVGRTWAAIKADETAAMSSGAHSNCTKPPMSCSSPHR